MEFLDLLYQVCWLLWQFLKPPENLDIGPVPVLWGAFSGVLSGAEKVYWIFTIAVCVVGEEYGSLDVACLLSAVESGGARPDNAYVVLAPRNAVQETADQQCRADHRHLPKFAHSITILCVPRQRPTRSGGDFAYSFGTVRLWWCPHWPLQFTEAKFN